MRFSIVCSLAVLTQFSVASHAHDTWVETNSAVVRTGEVVHVDLKLGNHGNEHRDFKLAGKITLQPCQLTVNAPGGESFNMIPSLDDVGFGPKDGYWSGPYIAASEGLHVVSHTLDTLHGTTRAIKSGKTFFVSSKLLDAVPTNTTGFEKPLGHPLELVPQVNPVTATGPGQKIRVQLLYQGKPLPETRVSFIPRGAQLAEGFDKDYEQMTDAQGFASYTPQEGNVILIVAHHPVADQKGEGYDKTHYSATLTIAVPQLCPHCIKALTAPQ